MSGPPWWKGLRILLDGGVPRPLAACLGEEAWAVAVEGLDGDALQLIRPLGDVADGDPEGIVVLHGDAGGVLPAVEVDGVARSPEGVVDTGLQGAGDGDEFAGTVRPAHLLGYAHGHRGVGVTVDPPRQGQGPGQTLLRGTGGLKGQSPQQS